RAAVAAPRACATAAELSAAATASGTYCRAAARRLASRLSPGEEGGGPELRVRLVPLLSRWGGDLDVGRRADRARPGQDRRPLRPLSPPLAGGGEGDGALASALRP